MRIGIPRETWPDEARVAALPSAARALVAAGHEVLVEHFAGVAAGHPDDAYIAAGAESVPTPEELCARGDLLWKVMPAHGHEARLVGDAERVWDVGRLARASDTVRAAMSEIAGRLAVEAASTALQTPRGGRGLLLGGVPGVDPAEVVVLGAGVAGSVAARLASAMGARVRVLDTRVERLRALPGVHSVVATPHTVEHALALADVVIVAVRGDDDTVPVLADRAHLAIMQPGAVVVDLSVAQHPSGDGPSAFATTPRTTLESPAAMVDGIVHIGVPNLAGAVPRTASAALSQAALPLLLRAAAR
ncbi:MAG: alanine dehydrogenase [Pseudomonadota bacterium]|jgi:alanine dehydrogenase